MDTEMLMTQLEQDFEALALEHDGTADNEYLWSLGAPDAEATKMHAENMTMHRLLARMYRRMKDDVLAFVETYDDGGDGDHGN